MSSLQKLANIGSRPILSESADYSRIAEAFGERVAQQVNSLLQVKNGFYAFEAALHVLPDLGGNGEKGLLEWNNYDLWRKDYNGMADDAVFFAEDVFGVQFCLRQAGVATFDPETGLFKMMASDLEAWAQAILNEYGLWTGHNVAHDWQVEHGAIPIGARLVPVIPFVLGGEFSAANVHAIDAVKGMQYRASIALQIRDIPDGKPVVLRVIE